MNTTMLSPLEELGKTVRERRLALNLSQEDLANICSFDRTYISLVERGKRNISFMNLLTLSKGLNLTLSELVEGIYGIDS